MPRTRQCRNATTVTRPTRMRRQNREASPLVQNGGPQFTDPVFRFILAITMPSTRPLGRSSLEPRCLPKNVALIDITTCEIPRKHELYDAASTLRARQGNQSQQRHPSQTQPRACWRPSETHGRLLLKRWLLRFETNPESRTWLKRDEASTEKCVNQYLRGKRGRDVSVCTLPYV